MDSKIKIIIDASESASTLGELRSSLKDINKELENIDVNSEEFQVATKRAQDLKLKIDQTLGAVDEFGNREPKNLVKKSFEDAAESATALVSSVSLLNVAFSDSETAQELQAKSLQAIAIAQNLSNIVKAKGAIVDTLAIAKTYALTAAQTVYTAVVGTSTGALRLFKLALASTGVGAVVILLGELIFNWTGLNKKIKEGIDYIKGFSTSVSGGNKVIKTLVDVLVLTISPLITLIRLINDFGGTVQEMQDTVNGGISIVRDFAEEFLGLGKVVDFLTTPFNLLFESIKKLDSSTGQLKFDVEDLTKTYERQIGIMEKSTKTIQDQIDLRKAQGATETEIAALTRKKLNEETAARKKAYDEAIRIRGIYLKQGKQLNEDEQKLFDEVKEGYEGAVKDQSVFEAEEATKAKERAIEQAKERIELEKKLNADIAKANVDAIKDAAKREEEQLKLNAAIEIKALEEQLKNLKGNSKQKEEATKLTAERITQINTKLNDDLLILDEEQQKKLAEQRLKDAEDSIKRLKDLAAKLIDETIKNDEKLLRTKEKGSDEYFQQLKENLERETDLQIQSAKDVFDKEKLLREQAFKAKLTQAILNNEDTTKIEEDYAAETKEAKEKLETDITDIELDAADKRAKIQKDEADKRQQQYEATIDKIKQVTQIVATAINDILAVVNENIEAQLSATLDRISSQAEEATNIVNKQRDLGLLSEREYQQQIDAIQQEQRNKEREAKKKAWKQKKNADIISAITNTAVAVTTQLGSGPIVGFVLAGLAAALGAVQIATIASQPEPKFARGGYVEGPGSSTSDSVSASLSAGEFVMNARATQAFLPILESMNDQGNNPEPSGLSGPQTSQPTEAQRVYVVESDITATQKKISSIKARSTF